MIRLILTCFILLFVWFSSFSQEYPENITLPDYTLEFSNTDSIDFPNYYNDKHLRDSIARTYSNWHDRAKNIEQMLIDRTGIKIDRDSLSRIVPLKDGSKKLLSPNHMYEEVEYTFDKAFEEYECLLFRIQWFEGNNYCLINQNSGDIIKLFGRPYFSPNGKYIISINADVEAGYSYNGIQLFEFKNNKFEKLWEFQATDWGSTRVKWIAENKLIIENYKIGSIDGIWTDIYFYKALTINNNKP